jgi:signal transduction histidine kinase
MNTGKLRIGNNWNAITIIALSQNNPMKAIAEFVENSIDAGAKTVTVVRGREKGEHYLKVIDDGAGIPLDAEGISDFKKELVIKNFSGFPVDTMLERIDELTLYTEENLR